MTAPVRHTGRRKAADWSEQTVGHLQVLERAASTGTGARWRVECLRCGSVQVVPASRLRQVRDAHRAGRSTSCASAECRRLRANED